MYKKIVPDLFSQAFCLFITAMLLSCNSNESKVTAFLPAVDTVVIKPPYMIMAQQFTDSTLPAEIKKNIAYIESMPFDGMFIHVQDSWKVMYGKALSYDEIYNQLSVLKGAFTIFKYNYLYVFISFPGDLWNDTAWKITAENFGKMAKASRAVGFKGIVYDNEEYQPNKWLNYGEVYRNLKYNLPQHRDKTMLRGRQVMEAMVAEFPNLEVFNFHGPYLSEPETDAANIMKDQACGYNCKELLGPFFVGMVQGKGAAATVIDGGEVYQYRTKEDFTISYDWRKHGIASNETNSWFITDTIRINWARDVQLSFGVYNLTWKPAYPMSAAIMSSTLENALRTTDKYVWYWTEEDSWFIKGKMQQAWIDTVRAVRKRVKGE